MAGHSIVKIDKVGYVAFLFRFVAKIEYRYLRSLSFYTTLSVFAALTACSLPGVRQEEGTQCGPEVRSAFDVGSGTTKLKVATVDTCRSLITGVHLNETRKLSIKEDVEKSPTKKISPELLTKAEKVFEELLHLANEKGGVRRRAVGTSGLRLASNAVEFTDRIKAQTGLEIQVISQDAEADLGYWSALAQKFESSIDRDRILVWDIGGGSQQIVYRRESGGLARHLSAVASVSFKSLVLKEVKKSKVRKLETPNPLTEKEANEALDVVKRLVEKETPQELKDFVGRGKVHVLGIGGVHFHSLRKGVGGNSKYSRDDLRSAIAKAIGKTDAQIGGEYAATDVTNLILVLGYMEVLGINEVQALNINLTDGVLVQPGRW